MAITNKVIRALNGGVSEQPDSLRRDNQCSEQINFLSDVVDGLVKRPGTEFLGELESAPQTPYNEGDKNVFTHEIVREGDTKLLLSIANGKLSLIDLADGSKVRVNDSAGVEITTAAQTYLNYSNAALLTHPYAAVTIADTTFILNKEITPAMKTTLSGGQTYNDHEIRRGMVFVKEGAYNAEYTITAKGNNGNTRTIRIKTSDGLGAGNVLDSKTDNICAAIHAALTDAATSRTDRAFDTTNYPSFADEDTGITITYTQDGTFNGGTYTYAFIREGSVLLWKIDFTGASFSYDDTEAYIDIEDSFGDSLASSFNETKGEFAGLPLVSAKDFNVQITGSPESLVDDYYVKFQVDAPNPVGAQRGKGAWIESLVPGIEHKLNENTMPHQLVKVSDTVYQFKEVVWDEKTVGDNNTDPEPSFIGNKINDIFFFKSRLGLLTGENVVLSELDNPYNFWRTTVTQVLASDRIDIQSSVNEITILNYAVPFANQLIVFSDRTQFIISFGSSGLNPQTAALSQIASYEASKNVRPVTIDNNIVFVQERSNSSAVYEMFPTGVSELSFEAQEITEQIPSYIQGKVIRMAGSSLSNSLVIQTDSLDDTLFIYKFFNRGRERVLSSWFKYQFDVNKIKGIHYVDDQCYKVSSLDLLASPGTDDTHVLDFFRLDNTENITYSADLVIPHTSMDAISLDGSGDTDVRLPLTGASPFFIGDYFDRTAELIVFDDQNVLATLKAPDTGSNFCLKIEGDWTSKTFFMAIKFSSEYEFSKQYLKRADSFGAEVPIVTGRTTIQWAEISMNNTQFMTVEVSYPNSGKTTTTKTFSGNVVGSVILGDQASETGILRTVVAARNDVPVVKLKSGTHQTATIASAVFQMRTTNKLTGRN